VNYLKIFYIMPRKPELLLMVHFTNDCIAPIETGTERYSFRILFKNIVC